MSTNRSRNIANVTHPAKTFAIPSENVPKQTMLPCSMSCTTSSRD
ncbi:hypothetical protein ANCCAN_27364 [Ancylostoma caninum]|uniref:Uncharacterized protein n=1 Tax=Ancylostoma caninum TaxID=29170 RepID=A0A368F5P1_ANCCA|nr:hypothetical protein ANCCAN_27364 [Ancylostoma caninum]